MLNNKLIGKAIANQLMNHEEIRKEKERKKLKKKQHKQLMIKMFGKARYYFAWWFGEWVLLAYNNRTYQEPEKEYTKFYREEAIANKYANKLQERYEVVKVTKAFDNRKSHIGYVVEAKGKMAADPIQQPSKVISFAAYKSTKVK